MHSACSVLLHWVANQTYADEWAPSSRPAAASVGTYCGASLAICSRLDAEKVRNSLRNSLFQRIFARPKAISGAVFLLADVHRSTSMMDRPASIKINHDIMDATEVYRKVYREHW